MLATKAHDAVAVAPELRRLLGTGGTLLPIQNGAVAQLLADRFGGDSVLGGLSNLGATMTAPGVYEQRNAGHLLVGELAGGESRRAERVRAWLGRGVEVRVTPNLRGAVWSKLLLNCSVTTIGAIIVQTQKDRGSLADFAATVEHRIRSLASTHELLSKNHWRGVSLHEIIQRELAPYASCDTEIGGPRIMLAPTVAQATGMVTHELTTNAAKYGALSSPGGRLSIRWHWLQDGSAHSRLAIEWQEKGGAAGLTIIGVMQSGFFFPDRATEMWIPATNYWRWTRETTERHQGWARRWTGIGRLRTRDRPAVAAATSL